MSKQINCKYIGKEERLFDGNAAWGFDIEIVDDPVVENYYLTEANPEHTYTASDTYEVNLNVVIRPGEFSGWGRQVIIN